MKVIVTYLFVLLAVAVVAAIWLADSGLFASAPMRLALWSCVVAGLFGGLVNCLRAVYLHCSVFNDWHKRWHVWYVVRPILSAVMGAVAYVFIRAGLFVFGGKGEGGDWSIFGYLVIGFIAGYNVQRFLEQLEAISEAAFGVKRKSTPQ